MNAKRFGLEWTMAFYLLLGFAYSVSVPPWEGSDEPAHYRLALALARGAPRPSVAQNYEASQPLPYYWMASWPLRLLLRIDPVLVEDYLPPVRAGLRRAPPQADAETAFERLPRHDAFDGLHVFDWNRATHRLLVGVHVVRWLGLGLGAFAVLLIHRACVRLAPGQHEIAAAAVALTALTPQFLHVQTTVSTDALANLAGAILFWLLVGQGGPKHLGQLAILILAALALPFLTKLTVLPLSFAALLCATGRLLAGRSSVLLRRHALALVAVLAALATATAFAPTWVRDGWNALLFRAVYLRPGALAEIPAIWDVLARSYWGTVGWMSIQLPAGAWLPLTWLAGTGAVASLRLATGGASDRAPWRYPATAAVLGGALLVAVLANSWLATAWFVVSLFLLHLAFRAPPLAGVPAAGPWRMVLLCAGLALLVVLKNALATLQAQGRYLLPCAGALSAVAIGGWMVLLPDVWRARLTAIVLGAMVSLNLLMLIGAIGPSYYQPFLDGPPAAGAPWSRTEPETGARSVWASARSEP